jgi:signal transduction histidine kinase
MKALEKDIILLEVQDDGVGFDKKIVEATTEQRGNLGLKNMSERAEMVNGVFQLDSGLGKGTIIQVVIPVNDEAIERLRKGG